MIYVCYILVLIYWRCLYTGYSALDWFVAVIIICLDLL